MPPKIIPGVISAGIAFFAAIKRSRVLLFSALFIERHLSNTTPTMNNSKIKPGDMIEVYVPQTTSTEDQKLNFNLFYGKSEEDKRFTPRFLVTAVRQNFDNETQNYQTGLELMKDTFAQEIEMDGAIIVSTPQELALQDVKRGIRMFDKLGVKIIGLVDNMSFFKGEDGKKYPIFGEGGVKRTAEEFSKEFLCEIPIDPEVGKSGDQGKPIVESNPDNDISKIYLDIAKKIKSSFIEN